jgi:hypothetical protein
MVFLTALWTRVLDLWRDHGTDPFGFTLTIGWTYDPPQRRTCL